MTSFCRIRLLVISTIAFYSVYLFSYKCHQKTLLESLLHPGSGSDLAHPFATQQDQLCDVLNTGADFVGPYMAKASGFLEQHVQSHDLFKKYDVGSKIDHAKAQYFEHVYPQVHRLMQYFEIAEYHAAVHVHNLVGQVKKHFHAIVVPKAHEAKDAAAAYADDAADKLSSQYETAKDAASSKLETAADVAASQAEVAQSAASSHMENAKDAAASTYEDAKDAAATHYEQAKDIAGDLYADAKDAAGNYYQQVVDAAGEQVDNAKDVAESLEEQFKTQLEAAKAQVKSKFE